MYFVVVKHWNVKLFGLFVYKELPLFDGFRPFIQKYRYHWYETGHRISARLAQLAIAKLKLHDF